MKKLSKEQMADALGTVGEKLAANYFAKNGFNVEISPFKYDSQKDMTIDNKKVEVKTQAPFIKFNSFTIRPNQLQKCKTVDCLIFVVAPHPKYKHFSDGGIYQVLFKKCIYTNWIDKSGTPRILISINQDAVKKLFQVTEDEANELTKYVYTGY
jgi:hypothetical protein